MYTYVIKSIAMSALHDIAKAWGHAPSALFCIKHEQGKALTISRETLR